MKLPLIHGVTEVCRAEFISTPLKPENTRRLCEW